MKISLSVLLSVVTMSVANASEYPSDYCRQSVQLENVGSAGLLALSTGGGGGGGIVLGYRIRGTLASTNPNQIDALITTHCHMSDGSNVEKTTTITMGKEWSGTGYLSSGGTTEIFPYNCYYYSSNGTSLDNNVQIAFSDRQGHWDSNYGQNYNIDYRALSSGPSIRTNDIQCGGIGFESWGVIVNAMKN
jgi:hypothetical protein